MKTATSPAGVTRPKAPPPWVTQAAVTRGGPDRHKPNSVRLGLLDDDPERALASLREHAADLTHLAPSWLQVSGMPPRLHETTDPDGSSSHKCR